MVRPSEVRVLHGLPYVVRLGTLPVKLSHSRGDVIDLLVFKLGEEREGNDLLGDTLGHGETNSRCKRLIGRLEMQRDWIIDGGRDASLPEKFRQSIAARCPD